MKNFINCRFTRKALPLAISVACLGLSATIAAQNTCTSHAFDLKAFPVKLHKNEVREAALRAHMELLSSDVFEGRGTGQRGGDLTMQYLQAQVKALGLQPAFEKSYTQPVKIASVKPQPEKSDAHFENVKNQEKITLAFGKDWTWWPGDAKAEHQFDNDIVFVGYGIAAPEEKWDDYKGMDVKNKMLIMMVNDPMPTAEHPHRFGGKGLTYYGRWTYKFEEAMRRGAAGVLLIHTDASATYGWSVVSSGITEKFQLKNEDAQSASNSAGNSAGNGIQGWISNESALRIFKASGLDLDALRASAEKADFKPVTLDMKFKGNTIANVREIQQHNIAAVVPGTDPVLKNEVVIYSAHWDHLGKIETAPAGKDAIYNGAIDNASGTAGLLAMAEIAVKNPAKRSQMFLWVAAEEQGLLGSAAYAKAPLWPLAKTVAALNNDSLNFVGATHDIHIQGSEHSDLAAIATQVARAMKLGITPATPDLGGGFFRSDHFSFAKVGIPAFSIEGGEDYIVKNAEEKAAAQAKAKAYAQRYHQVSDEYDPTWNLSGMVQQAQFTLNLGYTLANSAAMPQWKAGSQFAQMRQQTLPTSCISKQK